MSASDGEAAMRETAPLEQQPMTRQAGGVSAIDRPAGHHLYLHSEDLDGWLAPPNEPLLPVYRECFRELEGLCATEGGVRHELRIVLNSGKSANYLEAQARGFGGRYVIGSNGAAWRVVGGETRWFVPPAEDFLTLRALLGIPPDAVGVVRPALPGQGVEVVIEPGKRVGGGDVILTLFTDPAAVRKRWTFRGGIDRNALYDLLWSLIEAHRLNLAVLEPHADGALDVVPRVEERALAKWTLPLLTGPAFPGAVLHLTHGGDGSADLAAMQAPGVIPLSAAGCVATAEEAARRGVLSSRGPVEGLGPLDCYAQLARRGFYGPLSTRVAEVVGRFLPEM
jgi:hypothetical protein